LQAIFSDVASPLAPARILTRSYPFLGTVCYTPCNPSFAISSRFERSAREAVFFLPPLFLERDPFTGPPRHCPPPVPPLNPCLSYATLFSILRGFKLYGISIGAQRLIVRPNPFAGVQRYEGPLAVDDRNRHTSFCREEPLAQRWLFCWTIFHLHFTPE